MGAYGMLPYFFRAFDWIHTTGLGTILFERVALDPSVVAGTY